MPKRRAIIRNTEAKKAAREAATSKAASDNQSLAKEASSDANNNDKALFKTPLRMVNGCYPNLTKLASCAWTPRSAVTPIKQALAY